MQRFCLAMILGMLWSTLVVGIEKECIFYVAINGNDAWSGKLAAPNRAKTDGPFARMQHARDVIREKIRNGLDAPITVIIRGGEYRLSEPLLFESSDSGSQEYPISYKAFPGEDVTLSGGVPVTGWHKKKGNLWQTIVSEIPKEDWAFRQLFINGERRLRARTPNQGFLKIAENPGVNAQTPYQTPADSFRFAPGDIDASWTNPQDLEVVVLHFWVDTHLPVLRIDGENQIIKFSRKSRRRLTDDFNTIGARYYVDNVYEAMDQPGEWYLDRQTGVLSYLAFPNEDLRKATVIVPRLRSLLQLRGDPADGRLVQHLSFRDLHFANCEWNLPPDDAGDLQAANTVSGAILMRGAHFINITQCVVKNVGTYGIEISEGCRNCSVTRCEIADAAAGGIKINGGDAYSPWVLRTGSLTITDNHIHHLGQIYHSGVGILSQHSDDNLIAHNHIHHAFYTGISVGWVWGYRASVSVRNRIEYNHIHDIGQGLLSDMGGIYLLGIAPGTVVRNNRIHDINSWGYGGWGIYTDEGSTDVLIENNVVYRTKSAGFHQHYGKENIIRNNVFAFGREAQIMRTRMEPHLSFTFEKNIVYWENAPLLGSNWKDDRYQFDHNLYFRTDQLPTTFKDWSWDEWRKRGLDLRSLIADPNFYDPQNGDFTLRPDSPAWELGFRPIDLSQTGPRNWPPQVQEIQYPSSADGTLQPAMYYESGSPTAKPLLVGLHTWSNDFRQESGVPYAKWCQEKDWIFIFPNFRGPSNRPEATGSDLVVNDILSAVEYAKSNAQVDPHRIYLVGVSGGGYHALLLAGKAPQVWAAVSAWVPIADLEAWYYESLERGNRYAEDLVASCGGVPGSNAAVDREYKNRSPLHFLAGATGLAIDINAGIFDGHTGSVPVSHSLRAFNALAAQEDRIPEDWIDLVVKQAQVPMSLRSNDIDPFYGDHPVLFRRQSGQARVTLFDGGHEIIYPAALRWLEQKTKP